MILCEKGLNCIHFCLQLYYGVHLLVKLNKITYIFNWTIYFGRLL